MGCARISLGYSVVHTWHGAAGYAGNEMAQAAVERKFEVIGEALNQLFKLDAAIGTVHRVRSYTATSRRPTCALVGTFLARKGLRLWGVILLLYL